MSKMRIDYQYAAALWSVYQVEPCDELRNELVECYRELCDVIAWKMSAKVRTCACMDVEDLACIGTLGLIKAVERFDPSRGFKFATYAASRIRGTMLDAMRAQDFVPRNEREAQRDGTAGMVAEIGPLDRPDLVESSAAENPMLSNWLMNERCQRLLRHLDSTQRQIVAGLAEGRRLSEIAVELGVTTQAAKKALAAARERIAGVLNELQAVA